MPADPWITPEDLPCAALVAKAAEQVPPVDVAEVVAVASDLMWAASGRQFGPGTERRLRPCARSWCDSPRRHHHHDVVLPCDRRGQTLDLREPVAEVVSVVIDGQPFAAWRLDGDRLLVRTDGLAWPYRQDLGLASTEVDTWAVMIRPGGAVPAGGIRAVKVLACELLKARLPGEKCRLPARVRSAVRQGTTVEFLDDSTGRLRFGLDEVDRWLDSVNPAGLTSPSSVMSPDYRPHRSASA